VREVVEVSKKIGKGKESLETAVESKPVGVEQATEKSVVEFEKLERFPARVRQEPAEWFRENVGTAMEAVGAKAPKHGWKRRGRRRATQCATERAGGGMWMTPKAKKTARKRSMTS
jgi:hypothetical protein